MTQAQINEALLVQHHFSSGVYAKQAHIAAGMAVQQHVHDHDHLSILASGRVRVQVEGEPDREFWAPQCLTIKAGKEHKITAMTDSVWFCIHATDETDPAKVDDVILQREN